MAITKLVNRFHDSIENNDLMIGLFIDLSKAFDTISHEILFEKLHFYGIRGIALSWIKDYLSNRKQYVMGWCAIIVYWIGQQCSHSK